MPEGSKEKTRTIDDFAGLLETLTARGYDYLVIGGIAVGSYARLHGGEVLSADLDLYSTYATLDQILDWAPSQGIKVLKRPRPRSIPTAFLEWEGKEINILTYSHGLPPPDVAARTARVFTLSKHGNLEVLLASPFDLLRNKLNVNRPKDQPHIAVLKEFLEAEAVAGFEKETSPRSRLDPARQLLAATGSKTISEPLATRLLPLARLPSDLRFLGNTVPTRALAERVKLAAQNIEEPDRDEVMKIVERRRFHVTPPAKKRRARRAS